MIDDLLIAAMPLDESSIAMNRPSTISNHQPISLRQSKIADPVFFTLFDCGGSHPANGRFGAQSTQFRAISAARTLKCDSVEPWSQDCFKI
jgi:hypothetical protein